VSAVAFAPSVSDPFRLDGGAALITGADACIGRSTAPSLAEAGAVVAMADIAPAASCDRATATVTTQRLAVDGGWPAI
jgi:NAD(P)-dependent dehydrogenase (short-subunit alcohol dehydrogenase family)